MFQRALLCTYAAGACLFTACGGGGSNSPLSSNLPAELLVCRARIDNPHRFSEVALRTTRNLGTGRVSDRTGPETRVRLHPDGVRIVFARERSNSDPDSRELYASTIDGSAPELRLTVNSSRDDDPVWSPDGTQLLFTHEDNGVAGLWISGDTGGTLLPFLPVSAGFTDSEADWHAASDKIIFSRRDANGHHVLWLVNGTGFGAIPLTDGGSTVGTNTGDQQPAFSPDGATVVFVRRTSDELASLCLCDVATGTVTVRFAPTGNIAYPRFSPATDRFWFGLAEPDAGRQTLRLAHLPITGGEPTLAWPDERWRFAGMDFLPVAVPIATAGTIGRLDVRNATMQVTLAGAASGTLSQLSDDDDNEYYLRTTESGGRQIAGINIRFPLPVDEPEDVLEVRVRAIVRATRVGGDSLFRMSLRNLTDNRFDTVVELTPTSTGDQVIEFRTSSLRHITLEKVLQFTVIADLEPGDPADFWLDMVEVQLVPRLVE